MSPTDVFAALDAPLVNSRWSWGAVRSSDGSVFLRVWQDEELRIDGRDYMRLTAHEHFRKQAGSSLGFTERLKHVELVRRGARAFMIMCLAADVNATPRKIKSVEKKRVFMGGALIEHQGDSWLERAGAVSLAAARDGVDRSQPDSR